jgi:hypothetical protein
MPRHIWAIADPHLSFAQPKPMDIFGEHWRDHPTRIAKNCRAVIAEGDLLLMPGDLSWALKRKDAEIDLAWLAALPGIKVLCKGNHDYWWDSDRPLNYPGLHDTPYVSEDGQIGVAGTRGWYAATPSMDDGERAQCVKIIAREAARLEKRLDAVRECPIKFAMVHYPPLDEFAPLLHDRGIEAVLYGHLHLNGQETPLPEEWHGLRALCVAADRLHFAPRLVASLE